MYLCLNSDILQDLVLAFVRTEGENYECCPYLRTTFWSPAALENLAQRSAGWINALKKQRVEGNQFQM